MSGCNGADLGACGRREGDTGWYARAGTLEPAPGAERAPGGRQAPFLSALGASLSQCARGEGAACLRRQCAADEQKQQAACARGGPAGRTPEAGDTSRLLVLVSSLAGSRPLASDLALTFARCVAVGQSPCLLGIHLEPSPRGHQEGLLSSAERGPG